MFEIINLSGRTLIIEDPKGDRIIPKTNTKARYTGSLTVASLLNGIPLLSRYSGAVEGIGEFNPSRIYVVNPVVFQHTDRYDVVSYTTGIDDILGETPLKITCLERKGSKGDLG